jgi:hypothetical protein
MLVLIWIHVQWLCAAVFVARLLRRAASGHAAPAPPSSVMNWRRLKSTIGSAV